ncbi:TRAP transporter small permease [Nitratireductor aquimarinus]|uniref:TRAP transporter small permease subunit n=1 Tax=Nitratireductor aquimarinus TaxID=889300 RepID=UPI0029360475|nr:TRAP transporter small permease [Nitratireductor aquimarinus]MDV2968836.1 TRAP transporter small permease [Nitratireductor aquimarinus]
MIFLRKLSQLSVGIAGGCILLCAAAIGVEVVMRKLFGLSLGGVDEISSYVFATGVAWSLAFTLLERAHIRIDLLYERMPVRARFAADVLGLLCLLVVSLVLLQQAALVAWTSWSFGTRSNTPLGVALWVPQLAWVAGLLFFTLCQLALLVALLRLARAGRSAESGLLTGNRTHSEEAEDYMPQRNAECP